MQNRSHAARAGLIFFLLLCSYYILRPVRDEMGIQTGNAKLPWLFTTTFIATLILVPVTGWAARSIARRILVPGAFAFFVLNVLGFYLSFLQGVSSLSAGIFFVWLSIFNLLAVSLFWSRMGDLFSPDEAKLFYGYVSAGGTIGALVGPLLTGFLVQTIGIGNLLLISAAMLTTAGALLVGMKSAVSDPAAGIGGEILSGVKLTLELPLRRLAILVICYSTTSTLVYLALLEEVGKTSDGAARTSYFAYLDLVTNIVTLIIQTFVTARLTRAAGFRTILTAVPGLVALSLIVLILASNLPGLGGLVSLMTLLAIAQTLNRAGDYALMKPAREMIYATVDAERRYKAKSFIDTAVYRACDAAGSWLISAVKAVGASPLIYVGLPIALLWILTGFRAGKAQDAVQNNP
ncbi:MAG: hypothetical protein JNM27_12610 [Leptospirales bacterium]|nr:hypothetical protein [Leptospirales bacterium]